MMNSLPSTDLLGFFFLPHSFLSLRYTPLPVCYLSFLPEPLLFLFCLLSPVAGMKPALTCYNVLHPPYDHSYDTSLDAP